MNAVLSAILGWLCVFALLPDGASCVPLQSSLSQLDIRYDLRAAGDVLLIWGVNGWNPVAEALRPPGTVIRKQVMATPMVKTDGRFAVTIAVETGATVDYGFLVTKTAGGAFVELWDGNDSYRVTVTKPDVLNVKSAKLYQHSPVLMDRTGAILGIVLLSLFAALLATAGWLLWSQGRPVSAGEPPAETDLRFAVIVSTATLICGLIVILHHEMWRDEMQAWGIVTSSHTLSELFGNVRYEGHPALWYVCLYALSRLSPNPILMQLLHLAVGVAAIFLLCRYAPFTRWQKACLSFGYFPFYEYLIISRNYGLGVLAFCAFCAVQSKWPERVLISALLLAVMINTSAFGAIIALAFGGWLLLESFRRRELSFTSGVKVSIVLGIGVLLAGLQSVPPADNSPRILAWNTVLLGVPLEKTVTGIWRSYVPIPQNLPHFWGTNLLDALPFIKIGSTMTLEALDIQLVLSLGLLGISALLFARTPSVMLLFTVATGGLLLFLHLKVNHGIRHTGHLFLLLVGCLWLASTRSRLSMTRGKPWFGAGLVTFIFAIHTVVGGLAAATDLVYPFSESKETAEFIERHGLTDTPMVGSGYAMAAAVAAYLNHPVYLIENKQAGTFVRWGERRTRVTPAEVVRIAEEQARLNHSDILLILSYDLGGAGIGVPKLASFERSVLREERYWLYLLPYRTASTTGQAKF
jgi:hypothetical protein